MSRMRDRGRYLGIHKRIPGHRHRGAIAALLRLHISAAAFLLYRCVYSTVTG